VLGIFYIGPGLMKSLVGLCITVCCDRHLVILILTYIGVWGDNTDTAIDCTVMTVLTRIILGSTITLLSAE